MNKNNKYIKIFKEEYKRLVGPTNILKVESNKDDTRINVSIKFSSVETIFTNDGKFILFGYADKVEEGLEFDSEDFFREYAIQLIKKKVIPTIINHFRTGYIKELPDKLSFDNKTNLDNITKEWFIEEFEEIADDYSNGETLEDVEIRREDTNVSISFSVDCDRYGVHRDNAIAINDKGIVRINLCDLLDGGDIESGLRESLEKKIIE